MYDENLFAEAKAVIFNVQPNNSEEFAAFRMAQAYYEPIIRDAEAHLQGWQKLDTNYSTYLQQALTLPKHFAVSFYSASARRVIEQCCDNFHARYRPVLEDLTLKAA